MLLLQFSLLFILFHTIAAVTRPPTIIEGPPKQAVFIINEALKLPCKADADPPPKYIWYKNNRVFNTAARSGRYTVWPGEGTLIFIRPGEDDDGYYQCSAVNEVGVAKTVKTNLRRAEFKDFPPEGIRDIQIPLGKSLTLPCSKPNSFPEPEMSWRYAEGGALNNVIPSARTAIGIAGQLVFANVKKEDHNREFKCIVSNTRLNREKTSSAFRLIVTDQQTDREYPARVAAGSSPKASTGIEGDEVAFLCIFAGNPTPQITWKFLKESGEIDPTTMPDVRVDTAGVRLLFSKVRAMHAGTYRCQGQNRRSDMVTNEYVLTVRSRPKFINKPKNEMAPPGSQLTFDCAARGDSTPRIDWFKNGEPVVSTDRARLDGTKLHLFNLKPKDSGVFQCNASNKYGYDYADFYVNVVQEPPAFIHKMEPLTVMAEGQSVRLNCSTYSAPKANVAWKRRLNNQPLTGGRYVIESSGNLLINKLQVSDTGTYECTATNPYGSVHTSGLLEIRRRTIITVPPKDIRVYEKSDVKFVCAAETDPLETRNLKISWLKDGTPINFKEQLRVRPNPPDNSLIIGGVGPLDTGSYTCVASDGIDNATASASLVVQGRPNQPRDVNVLCEMTPTKREATVSWVSGSDNSAPILKFVVEFANIKVDPNTWFPVSLKSSGIKGSEKVISLNPSAVVVMNPGINYRFRVRARNIVGLSEPSEPGLKTCANSPALPSKNPTNLWAEGTMQNNLIVHWTPMSEFDQNGPQLEYVVTVRCLNCETMSKKEVNTTTVVNWRDNNIEFSGAIRVGELYRKIEIYKLFEVTIMSRNSKGDSTAQKVFTKGYSGEGPPKIKPSALGVVEGSARTVDKNTQMTLTWQVPSDFNSTNQVQGFFRGYRVEWCLAKLSDEKCEQEKQYQDYIINVPNHPLSMTYGRRRRRSVDAVLERYRRATSNVQYTLTRLPGLANLKAWVRIINKRYAGGRSNFITFTTTTGVPGAPAVFELTNRGVTHLSFRWNKPNQTNGVITSYQMGVQRITNLDLGFMKRFPLINDPNIKNGEVVGLKPKTQYRIYLWAATSAGFGVPTFLDATTSPANIAPGAPTLVAVPSGDTSINITFAPSTRGVPGSVFYAQYRLPGRSKWEESYREFSKRFIEIFDLPTDTLFVVRMVATNGAGLTAFSESIDVRTGGSSAAGLKAGSSTWFIIILILLLILIAGIVGLFYLRRYRYQKVLAVPTNDPNTKSGFGPMESKPETHVGEQPMGYGHPIPEDTGVVEDYPKKDDRDTASRHYQNVAVSQHQPPVQEFAEPPRYVDAMQNRQESPTSEEEWSRPPQPGRRRILNSQERLDGPPGSGSGAAINSGSLMI